MSSLCSVTVCLSSCSLDSFDCNETVDCLTIDNIPIHHSIKILIDRVIMLKGWEKKEYYLVDQDNECNLLTNDSIGTLVAPDHGINLYLVDPEAKDDHEFLDRY